MYSIEENKIAQQLECGSHFAYILYDNSAFTNTDYRVLLSQKNDIYVPCMKMTCNGATELYYNTDGLKSFQSMFANMTPSIYLMIASSIFASVLDIVSNGFLSCQKIEMSWDKVYVNPSTLKVKLVYVPTTFDFYGSRAEFENELRSNLVRLTSSVVQVTDPKIRQFLSDLSNGSLSINDLYNRTKGGRTEVLRNDQPIHDVNVGQNPYQPTPPMYQNVGVIPGGGNVRPAVGRSFLKLIAINPNWKGYEARLDKGTGVLGRKPENADVVLPYDDFIGRRHCKYVVKDGQYYLIDLESKNKTSINGRQLEPNQEYPIRKGDIVRMAGTDFRVE